MERTYREQIIDAINGLLEGRNVIFQEILDLALNNEYSHLLDYLDPEDNYLFYLNQFEDMEDINLRHMVDTCRKLEETIFWMIEFNDIDEDEIFLNGE